MKKMKELLKLHVGRPLMVMAFTLALVFSLCLFTEGFSIVSHAESAGRVTASEGAKVRSSASTSSDVVTSYAKDAVISIRSQVQASDGYVWYEVHVDDTRLGYVRSDLVEITDGSTPPTTTQVAPSTSAPENSGNGSSEVPGDLTQLNPVSATVVNGGTNGVRIRSNASTESRIITSVQNGVALTVTGQADSQDRDGKVWYYVNFISNGTEVTGFIRSDFVQLSEDPTPYTEPTEEPDLPEETPPEDENINVPQVTQDYDLLYQDGAWKLAVYNSDTPGTYDVDQLLKMVSSNQETYDKMQSSIKTQKVAIVILVILLVVAVGAIGFLIFKIKDMMDSAYFNEVENETLRRRSGQNGQRVTRDVGSEKRGAGQGQRPTGTRPAGAPQGQRPAGGPQGQRPAGAPQGQRPAGAPQGQRPAGAPQGQRPAGGSQGQRPAGSGQGQRPAGAPQGQRPTGAPQGQKPAGAPQGQNPSGSGQGAGRPQPKNFMADDDEFEFEFLNYDDSEQ